MFLRFKKNMKNNGICQGRLRLFHHMYGLYVCLLQVSSSALDHEDTTIHCGRKKDLCWQELKQCNKPTP